MTERCETPLGTRLRLRDDQWAWEPYGCSKPASTEGPDGIRRCIQHDRKARGLSGRWEIIAEASESPENRE